MSWVLEPYNLKFEFECQASGSAKQSYSHLDFIENLSNEEDTKSLVKNFKKC